MSINDFFEAVVVINLKRRPDRLEKVTRELTRHNIAASVAEARDGRMMYPNHNPKVAGQLGCMHSHLDVIEYAHDNNFSNILILEDDVQFYEHLEQRITPGLQALPSNWDIVYLGGNTNGEPGALMRYADGLQKVNYLLCLHAYAINQRAYDAILNYSKTCRTKIIDVIFAELQQKMNCFKIDPNAAWQAAGFSDIEQHKVDYHFMRAK